MKVLIVGSGGREHTIAWKIAQSPLLKSLYCAPGNAGTATLGSNVEISAEDIDGLLRYALDEKIDLTVVGPEAPLVSGIVDRFLEAGQRIAGPTRAASALEGSKAFAKEFMRRHGIPTADYRVCDRFETAEACLRSGEFSFPIVIKADGLAAGKGVFVCPDLQTGLDALAVIMRRRKFGRSGDRVVVEQFLTGEETSFMAFTDGSQILPMVPSQDHKAIYEGDQGPNTGGMGAYSTDTILTPGLRREILSRIVEPTIAGMAKEGSPYRGILYAGLMLTREGPKVLEFNVRFGDPEAQVVLPRLESDLLKILISVADGSLGQRTTNWLNKAVVCVVIASDGYPGSYETGVEISGLDLASEIGDTVVFHAGTALRNGRLVTSGGRVLGVTALAPTLEAAIMQAYEGVNKIHFEGMYYRRDIASKGLRRAGGESR